MKRKHLSEQRKKQRNPKSLANLKKFEAGQSGNPGGRPKSDKAAEIAQAIFDGNVDAITKAMLKALKKGNPKVFSALADRAYGKPAQAHEVTGEGGGPVIFALKKIG